MTVERLYRPAEVAELLGCSQWWVKEQARKRRVPFSWIGGSYRFTAEQVDEIVRLHEVLPTHGAPATNPIRRVTPIANGDAHPTGRLKARTPRRAARNAA
jgi:excisionase family DNA binding protein